MVTIRTIENVKLGAKITLINGIYAVLLGVFYMLFRELIVVTNFRSAEAIWQLFAKYNPEVSGLFIKSIVLHGIFIVAFGIGIVYLSQQILKKKEKSTWIALFLVGLIFWASSLTIEALNKNVYTMSASLIGWLSFVIGMLIPIKYYTQKNYDYV